MSNQKIRTSFNGYENQAFPANLEELNMACNKANINKLRLEHLARTIKNYKNIKLEPITEDEYKWHCGLYFETRKEKIVILFPWQQDFKRSDGITLDRSIAIYTKGRLKENHINDLIKKLTNELI